jgi:hypothetical protein
MSLRAAGASCRRLGGHGQCGARARPRRAARRLRARRARLLRRRPDRRMRARADRPPAARGAGSVHICAGTGAHPSHICAGTGLTPPTSAPGLARACLGCGNSVMRRSAAQRARAQIVYWARRAGGRVLNIGSIRAAAALLEASQPSLPHHDGRYSHHELVACGHSECAQCALRSCALRAVRCITAACSRSASARLERPQALCAARLGSSDWRRPRRRVRALRRRGPSDVQPQGAARGAAPLPRAGQRYRPRRAMRPEGSAEGRKGTRESK